MEKGNIEWSSPINKIKEPFDSAWENPNVLFGVIRCTNVKYARNFMEKGQIKFSTPREWESYAIKGRGDVYEGTKAFACIYDIENVKKLCNRCEGTEQVIHDNRIIFKYTRSMKLPCLCMYKLNIGNFSVPDREGWQNVHKNIPATYFKDFADHKSRAEISAMPEEERPAIYVINNFPEFKKRLIDRMLLAGCKEKEIEIAYVSYCDFEKYEYMEIDRPQPKELFVKSKRFANQNELRIIINTDNKELLKTLESPIELGNMEDIASISENYFDEGFEFIQAVNAQLVISD